MASNISLSSSSSSNEEISMHISRLKISGKSSNIRTANSRRKNQKTEDFDYSQTYSFDLPLESTNSPSRSLINSQRFSRPHVYNNQDKLQKRLLQRNHQKVQQTGRSNFSKTCQSIIFSSSSSENSPNSSRERDLSIEEAIRPGYWDHSTPDNSRNSFFMPPIHFSSGSGSSNDSLENSPPSIHYGNSM